MIVKSPFYQLSALTISLVMLAPGAAAKDYFLTVGGGYSPTGNQVSLEKNVQFFQSLLKRQNGRTVSHDIFFSDGRNPRRDLQFADPAHRVPLVNQLLARVYRSERYLPFQYRDHQLRQVNGASSKANLEEWFTVNSEKLVEGDRLVIYVTAHGGKAPDSKKPHDTLLFLWDNERILVHEFVELLDKLNPSVQVTMVMVQCYSGGYANVIFKQGDPAKGLSEANRCGFYATVQTRPAAGCTADVNEDNYQEYSSYFWAAIGGQTRTGAAVENCDYDNDGLVSFAEAHAYSLLASATIDVSITTSDVFLRRYSTVKTDDQRAVKRGSSGQLISPLAPIDQLLAIASPSQATVIRGLSAQLGLNNASRAQQAQELGKKLVQDKKKIDLEKKAKVTEYGKVCGAITRSLVLEWPEFSNRWHPELPAIISRAGRKITEHIEAHADYKRMQQLHAEIQKMNRQRLDLDRTWAKSQRLLRQLENIALVSNLPHVADQDTIDRYNRMLTAESQTLPLQRGQKVAGSR